MPEMMVCGVGTISKERKSRTERRTHLLRFGIDVNAECRVLLLETVEGTREVGGLLTLGADGEGDNGLGDEHGGLQI